MRRSVLTCSLLASLSMISCAPGNVPSEGDGPVATARGAIAYGTTDNVHSAVVALLADAGGGSFTECSGTVVQVKNNEGYILTAAHCCNQGAPAVVVASVDYMVGVQYIGGGNPVPPSFKVVPGSVYYDSLYDQSTHDFCMLKAANMPANTPVIPVALPGADGLQIGVKVEHVGYGVTDNNQNNSGRRHGTNTVNLDVTPADLQYSQGGPQKIPGPCEGDSGGPALMPAGAAQAQQKVVGVTSYGNSASCSQGSVGVSMRVSQVTGPNGFITNFLNDTPTGTPAGQAVMNCNSCAQSAQNGACSAQTQACVNDAKCIGLNNCLQGCQSQACVDQCVTTAGQAAANKLNAVNDCICNTACVDECVVECGGSGSSSSSSSSSGGECGLTSNDPACDACLTGKCCGQAQDCVADSSCTNCLQAANPPPACNNDAAYVALFDCLNNNCAMACGGGSSSSSSSSSSTGSSSSSTSTSSAGGSTSSSGGVGGGGVGGGSGSGNGSGNGGANGTGTGSGANNGTGGGDVTIGNGCSASGSSNGSGAPLLGLFFGVALAVSRRRRG